MIALSPATRIYLAAGATDLRKGFEGLSDLVKHPFKEDPLSGHLYVFTNRRRNRVKLLYSDTTGRWLCVKAFYQGCYGWPKAEQAGDLRILAEELTLLLSGIDLEKTSTRPWWRMTGIRSIPKRTLQALYLDPLRARAERNSGSVFPGDAHVTLLIDLKSDAETTYAKLRAVLQGYTNLLTRFTPSNTITNAVTVILSGNRPTALVAGETERYAAIYGRLPDLESNPSPHLVPLISDHWNHHFTWRGQGSVPEAERQKLRRLVDRAHQQGRRIRFWAIPDNPAGWAAMQTAGVDLINTDRLAELRDFLREE